ncbi:hypothetical protein M4914_18750 [Streptomyces somaliensis DSM 40738]|uniref:Uncharacterized protein n=1 Tax=Streptomyces somaliensis (strain ATCC 33201 / DSM 40738 / JCM 12659 / KCTC 9044 / NCTC 11332 / NRRL B-12077 / IP 733) TaxID=1134445 RepID=A0AA44IBP2_STRE0|nr:hypothetical protein [Streptomyces somaliensis]MCQ0024792.1 hypothetical protein [Streptomyces somaliensis DSM 40738]NKY12894.1 hypothetical protein [Streptomyces somaliensis DSM 40738]
MAPRPRTGRAVVLGSLLLCAVGCLVTVAHADGEASPSGTVGGLTAMTASAPGTAPAPTSSGPGGRPGPGIPVPPGSPTGFPTGSASSSPAGPSSPGPGGPETGSPSRPATGSPSPPLAGRPAGAGRERPGRSEPPGPATPSASPAAEHAHDGTTDHGRHDGWDPGPEAVPDDGSHAAVPPDGGRSTASWESHGRAAETGVDRRVPVLTLGAGLTLMGIGLGFIGFRVRRV